MFPVLKAVLPKAGISSNIDTATRDGPIDSLGSGCLSFFHYMGTSRTSIVMEQITHKTPLCNIILINIEDLAIYAGLYGSVWTIPFNMVKKYIMNHSWLYAVLEYNFNHNIKLSAPPMGY